MTVERGDGGKSPVHVHVEETTPVHVHVSKPKKPGSTPMSRLSQVTLKKFTVIHVAFCFSRIQLL